MADVPALEEALGSPPPRGIVDAVAPEDLEHLAELIDAARRNQRQALRDATESAFGHIPFPLRGAVKKILR